jgi:hypothetical protein
MMNGMGTLYNKIQIEEPHTDIKNIKEICISATFDDMTRFYVLASSSEERKLAIESGCAEVINYLQPN